MVAGLDPSEGIFAELVVTAMEATVAVAAPPLELELELELLLAWANELGSSPPHPDTAASAANRTVHPSFRIVVT